MHVVMVQDTGMVAPLGWMFVLGIFSQPPQNITTEVSIPSLSSWNTLLTHDALSVQRKPNQIIDLTFFSNVSCFLGSQ
jgi:hypothetical protein